MWVRQELEALGVRVSLRTVERAVEPFRRELRAAEVATTRFETPPGYQLQIDFGERDVQPEAFGSIPEALWWAVITLTTIGYGDVYPVTPLGKVLTTFVALLGLGMVAIPTGLLAAALMRSATKSG